MKKTIKKTSKQIFEEYLNSIPKGDYNETIEKLCKFLGVSSNVIYFWRNGRTEIKPAYQKLINIFAKKQIFK